MLDSQGALRKLSHLEQRVPQYLSPFRSGNGWPRIGTFWRLKSTNYVSIPFRSGNGWPHKSFDATPDAGECFNPLQIGERVATITAGFDCQTVSDEFQSPSDRGKGGHLIMTIIMLVSGSVFQSPSDRGKGGHSLVRQRKAAERAFQSPSDRGKGGHPG